MQDIVFPPTGRGREEVANYLSARLAEIPNWAEERDIYRLGFPMTQPHPLALEALAMYQPANPNNVGIHMRDGLQRGGSRRLECEVLSQLASLLHGSNVTGYLTSGGTEGNLYGLWVGRNRLRHNGATRILVLSCDLTHYSIAKIANILDLPVEKLRPTNRHLLPLDQLHDRIWRGTSEGWDGFIIVSTAGYYSTGLVDEIEVLSRMLGDLSVERGTPFIHHHVDAAYGGFVLPFSNPSESFDFRNEHVHSLSLDAHKMGLLPYSCGIVFCRSELVTSVASWASMVGVTDETVAGSRPGAAAAALWAVVNSLGYDGYRRLIERCIEKRDRLAEGISEIDPGCVIVKRNDMNVLAVSFSDRLGTIPENMTWKYRLVPNHLLVSDATNQANSLPFYHIYATPSLSDLGMDRFLSDLAALATKQ